MPLARWTSLIARHFRARRGLSPRSRRRNHRHRPLLLDSLEDRFLLSGIGFTVERSALVDSPAAPDQHHSRHIGWSSVPGAPATVSVFVHDQARSPFTAEQRMRISDAISELNRAWDSALGLGLQLVEVSDRSRANIHVSTGQMTACGGRAQGVLGCAEYYVYATATTQSSDQLGYYQIAGPEVGLHAKVTLVQQWDWYAGADVSHIAPDEYDFTTVVTHELAHAVGLDHNTATYVDAGTGMPLNDDGHSAMYPSLAAGETRRQLSEDDLESLRYLYAFGPEPENDPAESPDGDPQDPADDCDSQDQESPPGAPNQEKCDLSDDHAGGSAGDSGTDSSVFPHPERRAPSTLVAERAASSRFELDEPPVPERIAPQANTGFLPTFVVTTSDVPLTVPVATTAGSVDGSLVSAVTQEVPALTLPTLAARSAIDLSSGTRAGTVGMIAESPRSPAPHVRAFDAVFVGGIEAIRLSTKAAVRTTPGATDIAPRAQTALAAGVTALLLGYWSAQSTDPLFRTRQQFLLSHLLHGG